MMEWLEGFQLALAENDWHEEEASRPLPRYYESELSGPYGEGEHYVLTTDEPGALERVAEQYGERILWDMRGNPDYEFTKGGKSVNGNSPDYE